jgi:7,8-dihydropterin-6-yl-methyl-4-(beta-D-ribofuranosyl)aminobenzene 5'-phosphate synthase
VLLCEDSSKPEARRIASDPKGRFLIVGCSHPGIEKTVEAVTRLDEKIYAVFGGFHLLSAPDAEIYKLASTLHEEWKAESAAPGHCTGLPAFAALKALYGENYLYAGLDNTFTLP